METPQSLHMTLYTQERIRAIHYMGQTKVWTQVLACKVSSASLPRRLGFKQWAFSFVDGRSTIAPAQIHPIWDTQEIKLLRYNLQPVGCIDVR